MYTIESGIQIPEKSANGRESKYPLTQLQKDQSFFVPAKDKVKAAHNVSHAAYVASKRSEKSGTPVKFAVRVVEHEGQPGVRVWRIQ